MQGKINKENWLILAMSDDNTNRLLALETAASIAAEIQLELFYWHDQLRNPYHKIRVFELLNEEYKQRVRYAEDMDQITPFEIKLYYKIISNEKDKKLRKFLEKEEILNYTIQSFQKQYQEDGEVAPDQLKNVLSFLEIRSKYLLGKEYDKAFWKDYLLRIITEE